MLMSEPKQRRIEAPPAATIQKAMLTSKDRKS
jgi:hypothetical protein